MQPEEPCRKKLPRFAHTRPLCIAITDKTTSAVGNVALMRRFHPIFAALADKGEPMLHKSDKTHNF
jgi:hypothetical protein